MYEGGNIFNNYLHNKLNKKKKTSTKNNTFNTRIL